MSSAKQPLQQSNQQLSPPFQDILPNLPPANRQRTTQSLTQNNMRTNNQQTSDVNRQPTRKRPQSKPKTTTQDSDSMSKEVCTQMNNGFQQLLTKMDQMASKILDLESEMSDLRKENEVMYKQLLDLLSDKKQLPPSSDVKPTGVDENSLVQAFYHVCRLHILASFLGKSPLYCAFPQGEKAITFMRYCAGLIQDASTETQANNTTGKDITGFLTLQTIIVEKRLRICKSGVRKTGEKKPLTLHKRIARARSQIHDKLAAVIVPAFLHATAEFKNYQHNDNSVQKQDVLLNTIQFFKRREQNGHDALRDRKTYIHAFQKAADALQSRVTRAMNIEYREIDGLLTKQQVEKVIKPMDTFYRMHNVDENGFFELPSTKKIPIWAEAFIVTKLESRMNSLYTKARKALNNDSQLVLKDGLNASHINAWAAETLKISQQLNRNREEQANQFSDQSPSNWSLFVAYGNECQRSLTTTEKVWLHNIKETQIANEIDINVHDVQDGEFLHDAMFVDNSPEDVGQAPELTPAQEEYENEEC